MENSLIKDYPEISFDIVGSILNSKSPLKDGGEISVLESVMRYKKFLWLAKHYPNYNLVPTADVDECWHEHMLNPKFYYIDCFNYFGKILNHVPLRNKEMANELNIAATKTELLWKKEFKEEYKNEYLSALCGSEEGSCCKQCKSDCNYAF